MQESRRKSVVSLFSGALGMDLGFELQGDFEILACVEINEAACETIRTNAEQGHFKGKPKVLCRDIFELLPQELMASIGLKPGELDLLIGGPPCQSFSTAGRRQSVQDRRGTLLWRYLEFVVALRPKAFVMENVRGLMSAALKHRPIAERPEKGGPELSEEEEHGSVMAKFVEDLRRKTQGAYRVDAFEVNSANYGAPQIRERVVFIGNSFGVEVEFPQPTHGIESDTEQSDLFSMHKLKPWATLRDAIGDLRENNPELMDFSPRKKGFLSLVPEGGNWRSLPINVQQESMGRAWYAKGGRSGWWRRLSWDFPCPTLVTMPNHASTSLCHPEQLRVLSVKEYARIQEFPDEWVFCGKTSEKYLQIGNAVPVRLGKVTAQILSNLLDAMGSGDCLSYRGGDQPFRRVYIKSHVRTRRWYKAGEIYAGTDGVELAYASK
ncbi:DNA (cytosine-5)-methyltransferase 1 [Paracoccus alkenifer]|uniref:Cytosine-specific methyltransferase n=1 Tax=Paracoccus alkenifer TaxID=65735 RepID=A0A1H6K3E5_9RHOB|nr:DNA (cytosine-5)-methyltransferase 1 [Paracoccus alkenifer]